MSNLVWEEMTPAEKMAVKAIVALFVKRRGPINEIMGPIS